MPLVPSVNWKMGTKRETAVEKPYTCNGHETKPTKERKEAGTQRTPPPKKRAGGAGREQTNKIPECPGKHRVNTKNQPQEEGEQWACHLNCMGHATWSMQFRQRHAQPINPA